MIYKRPTMILATMILGLPSAFGQTIAVDITVGPSPQILNFSTTRGWLFSANSDMTITQFGLWDDNSDGFLATHRLNIWTNTGTQISQVFVDNTSVLEGPTVAGGQFRYSNGVPVDLSAGNQYVISVDMTGDAFINDGIASITSAPELTWLEGRFGSGVAPVFPTNTVPGNKYFGPNFKFTSVPEPSTFMILTGVCGLGLLRRRQRI